MFFAAIALLCALCIASAFADHPTLPTAWIATTNEPGMGVGTESYNFNPKPTADYPSSLWSNYTDCDRLIHVVGTQQTRYLLGCDAVDCCYETQTSNQVEFQIPNIVYSDPRKKVEVSYARANVTTFGQVVEADEWSWAFAPEGITVGEYKAYTLQCDDCVNGVQLINWKTRAFEGMWYSIDFQDYKGVDLDTDEGKAFSASFDIPAACQGNIVQCN